MLPVNLPQQPSITGALLESSIDQSIEPNASFVMDTADDVSISQVKGSAQLSATGDVGGFAILRLHSGAQEVAVPLETRNAASYLLAFDNTDGVELGVALQNVSGTAAAIPALMAKPIKPSGPSSRFSSRSQSTSSCSWQAESPR